MPFQNAFPIFAAPGVNHAPQPMPFPKAPAPGNLAPVNTATKLPVTTMPVNAAMAAGLPKKAPPATVRMQSPDTLPVPAAHLVLPAPEKLGIKTPSNAPAAMPPAAASPTAPPATTPPAVMPTSASTPIPAEGLIDWNAVHARLGRLGATEFHLGRLGQSHRVTFLLPTGDQNRFRQVEASDANQSAAVNAALEQAETWVRK
jgi:hypothetical protein